MELEVCFISIQHAIEPGEELLRAVIGVQDDRDSVRGSNRSNVVGSGNSTCHRGLLLVILDTLQTSQCGHLQDIYPELVPFPRSRQHLPGKPGG